MIIELSLYILICIISLSSIYTDLRYGIIKNKHLVYIGFFSIFINFINTVNSDLDKVYFIINIIIGIFISLVLYFSKIWAGGDCKLFIILILSIPIKIINRTINNLSYIFYILILAFLFGYIYIICDSIYQKFFLKKETNISFEMITNDFKNYIKIYLIVTFINRVLLMISTKFFSGSFNESILVFLNILIIYFLKKNSFFKNNIAIFMILIIDLLFGFIDISYLLSYKNFLVWLVIIISFTLRRFVDEFNYEEIQINELKPGMILSTTSSFIFVNDKLSKFKKLSDETLKSRLSENDIDLIFDFIAKRKYIEKIKIVRKIPFASFICISTLIILVI